MSLLGYTRRLRRRCGKNGISLRQCGQWRAHFFEITPQVREFKSKLLHPRMGFLQIDQHLAQPVLIPFELFARRIPNCGGAGRQFRQWNLD